MQCTSPILIEGVRVPCGQCLACRLNYSRMWAVRCYLESLGYKRNCFVTLTFNDDHLPKDRSVKKRHLQNFMKRLRKSIYPAKVRFFGCGEYGEQYQRPHYHVIIFGLDISSPVFYNTHYDIGKRGFWASCKAWTDKKGDPLGHVFVGSVSMESAQYVAKYVVKKQKGKGASKHYKSLGLQPEFCLSSRRPGLGYDYLKKNQDQIVELGYVSVDGKKQPLPRFFTDKLKKDVPFYSLRTVDHSLDTCDAQYEHFEELYNSLDDAYSYLQDEMKQKDINLKKHYKERTEL